MIRAPGVAMVAVMPWMVRAAAALPNTYPLSPVARYLRLSVS